MMKLRFSFAIFLLINFSAVRAEDDPFAELDAPEASAESGVESSAEDESLSEIDREIEAQLREAEAEQKAAEAAPANPTFEEENRVAEGSAIEESDAELESLEFEKGLELELQGTQEEAFSSGLLSDDIDAPVMKRTEEMSALDVLEAQLDDKVIFGADGSDLQQQLRGMTPSEIFSRIPLRSPMSDANWLKWAGPMIEKKYVVRRRDNLWVISTRLFGTPYLWPKIWHLNARVTNPNIIEPKTELSFSPANPHSAPELAYTPNPEDPLSMILPSLGEKSRAASSLLEVIDSDLRNALSARGPAFRDFLLEKKPRVVGEVPELDFEGKQFYGRGDYFKTTLADGNYNVIDVKSFSEDLLSMYRVRWLGRIRVRRRLAEVIDSFEEILPEHEIVQREFAFSPLAVHEAVLGPIVARRTKLVPLAREANLIVAPHQVVGIRFPYSDAGPRPGAVLTLDLGNQRRGQALLIDRDQRAGTLWLLSADREVVFTDKLL